MVSKAWEERNAALHYKQNAHVVQSEQESSIRKYYKEKDTICIRDQHLFEYPMQDSMLKAKAGTKRRFLEKAEFLFAESSLMAKNDQQYIQKFYSAIIRQPRDNPTENTVWPQHSHST